MQISTAFEAYARDIIVFRNQSRKTEENHYVCMKALIIHFGDVAIESLSFPMIRDWKEALSKCRSPETVRNYIIKLRVVLDYLQKQGIPVLNPDQIPVPKRQDKVPVFLSADQVAQCIAATRRVKNKAIVSLLYSSGIRISELCALNRGQYHDGCFTVVGKGGKARLCFVDDRTKELCKQYYATRTDNDPAVFLSDSGQRITPGVIQETFKTIRRQTGIQAVS